MKPRIQNIITIPFKFTADNDGNIERNIMVKTETDVCFMSRKIMPGRSCFKGCFMDIFLLKTVFLKEEEHSSFMILRYFAIHQFFLRNMSTNGFS